LYSNTLRAASENFFGFLRAKSMRGKLGKQIASPLAMTIGDKALHEIVEAFLNYKGSSAGQLVEQLSRQGIRGLNRQAFVPLLREAHRRRIIKVEQPRDIKLAEDLRKQFDIDGQLHIEVVSSLGPSTFDQVASVAADVAYEKAQEICDGNRGSCVLGLTPGRASREFSLCFADRLRKERPPLKLELVATGVGGISTAPQYSTAACFPLFPEQYVTRAIGMFGPNMIMAKDLKDYQKHVGVREAFARAEQINIIITGMGYTHYNPDDPTLGDPHDLLRQSLLDWKSCHRSDKLRIDRLLQRACGNIAYRMFDNNGSPIIEEDAEPRPLTLFELEGLKRLGERKHRHVILVVRRCGMCQKRNEEIRSTETPKLVTGRKKANESAIMCNPSRAEALLPILREKSLHIFSHLILDAETAREVLSIVDPTSSAAATRLASKGFAKMHSS
jgi:DNA-binding transcriptional regulator LsrR (DeoR family)